MDESARLKAEIAYWSDLISTHKQVQLSKARKTNLRSFRWNGSDRKLSFRSGASSGDFKKFDRKLAIAQGFNSHEYTKQKHSPSKYKWKQNPNSSASTSQASNSVTTPTNVGKGVGTKHKLDGSVSTVPPKKKTLSKGSAHLVTKQHALNCYKWSKNNGQTSSLVGKQLPNGDYKQQCNKQNKPMRSRHVWKRRRSGDSVKHKTVPSTLAGKQIVTKYKLRRVHSKSRVQRQVNVSSNPYKVIRKSSGNVTKSKTVLGQEAQYTKTHVNKQSRSNHYKGALAHFTHSKRSKYKLVRPKNHVINVQTRNPQSGNIVLKRKQVAAKDHSVHHKQQYFYSAKQKLASQVLQKSLSTVRQKNRHKLRKVFCLFYNRFGRCNRGDKCQYVHDPERVAVCTRFLRGTCRNDSCLFSHKISKKKVPVCSFFLQGKCSTKNCPYLHVFVGHTADVCEPFATTGYCQKAENCKQKHINVCPDFYNKGTCAKKSKCNLPHISRRSKVRKSATKRQNATTRSSAKEKEFTESDGYISLPKLATVATELPDAVDQPIQTKPRLGRRKPQS